MGYVFRPQDFGKDNRNAVKDSSADANLSIEWLYEEHILTFFSFIFIFYDDILISLSFWFLLSLRSLNMSLAIQNKLDPNIPVKTMLSYSIKLHQTTILNT